MPRGGKRPGAGRKAGAAKTVERKTALKQADPVIKIVRDSAAGKAVTAAVILAAVDEQALWLQHLNSDDQRIAIDALKYLTDQRDGKATQRIERVPSDNRDQATRLRGLLGLGDLRPGNESAPGRAGTGNKPN